MDACNKYANVAANERKLGIMICGLGGTGRLSTTLHALGVLLWLVPGFPGDERLLQQDWWKYVTNGTLRRVPPQRRSDGSLDPSKLRRVSLQDASRWMWRHAAQSQLAGSGPMWSGSGWAHAVTGAVKKIEIFLTMFEGSIRDSFLNVVVTNNARVQDLIGLICWHYTNKGLRPELKENVENYCLMIAEEDGEVDMDFPALDSKEAISKFGFNTLALVEKDVPQDEGKGGAGDSIIVTIKSSDGESRLAVDTTQITLRQILTKALRKRKGIIPTAGPHYLLEKTSAPGVPLDLDLKLCEVDTMNFIMVREH
ncbi:target of rapamycin complex 2 subunit MAPKAP1-like, partial [Diadema antillarum]|uniref:target of rapamycin complex 2 subunit MAPKAP1-like n=1 Tax=Diadema antillarum TaxID=105358 RepID=UPI003A856015